MHVLKSLFYFGAAIVTLIALLNAIWIIISSIGKK